MNVLIVIAFSVSMGSTTLLNYRTSVHGTLETCLHIHDAFLKPEHVGGQKGIDFNIQVECMKPSDTPPPVPESGT
jgi:hypothetical protein